MNPITESNIETFAIEVLKTLAGNMSTVLLLLQVLSMREESLSKSF